MSMAEVWKKAPEAFLGNPIEEIKNRIYVSPFYEEGIDDLINLIGVEQVLYGSDWPHPEGLAEPTHYVTALEHLSVEDQAKIMLQSTAGLTSTLVDGGILSNFPIDSLDRADGRTPRWPSFGVTVLPNLPEGNDKVIPGLAPIRMLGPPHLLESVIITVLVGRDQAYLSQPWVNARAIRVDSTDVGFLDFDISDNEIEALYAKGYAAAEKFLSTWDWDAYLDRFR